MPSSRDEDRHAEAPHRPTVAEADACRALLRRHFLLQGAATDLIERLARLVWIERRRAGEMLFLRGDPSNGLYGILAGEVRIVVASAEGDEVLLNALGPDEMFGEIALVDGADRSATAVIGADAKLMRIAHADFRKLLMAHPEVSFGLLQLLCRRLRAISETAQDHALLPLPGRLAKRILAMADACAADAPGARELRYSQGELAQLVGAARESVNRVIGRWRQIGLVSVEGRRMTIRDRAALAALAGYD
jgi:CRP-like cAMP-binding protein